MTLTTDELLITIAGQNRDLIAKLEQAGKSFSDFKKRVKKDAEETKGHFKKLSDSVGIINTAVKGFLGLKIVQALWDLGKAAIKGAADLEQQEIAFTTMLGSGEKAKALINDMRRFAAETPFELPGIIESGKTLVAFQESAETVVPTLRRLGDIAAGLGVPLNDLATLYGKARVQQTLYTQDIMELANRGIPIFTELGKVMGVSSAQVKDMASKGQIGFKELQKVIKNLTDEGGQFAGLMAAQSQSLAGLFSTLKDNFYDMLTSIGVKAVPALKDFVEAVSLAVQGGGYLSAILGVVGTVMIGLVRVTTLTANAINTVFSGIQKRYYELSKNMLAEDIQRLALQYEFAKTDEQRTKLQDEILQKKKALAETDEKLKDSANILNKSTEALKNNWDELVNSVDESSGKIQENAKKALTQKPQDQGSGKVSKTAQEYIAIRAVLAEHYKYQLTWEEFLTLKKQEHLAKEKTDAEQLLALKYNLNYQEYNHRRQLLNQYYGLEATLADQMNRQERARQTEAAQAYQAYLQAKIGMDTTYWQGISAITATSSTYMQNENEKLFRFGQGLSMVQATINTIEAVTKTMAHYPYPYNIALGAIVGLAGGLQVAAIAKQKPPRKQHSSSPKINEPRIKGYAAGGLITGSYEGSIIGSATPDFRVAEKGMSELIMPIDNPTVMKKFVAAFANAGFSQGNAVTVQQNISIAGNVLSDEYVIDRIIPRLKTEAARQNKELFYKRQF